MTLWAEYFKGKRILVVEDDFTTQEMMKDIFSTLDCHLDIVDNGLQAVEICKQRHYDLILMDIKMPEKDGFQATMEIRQQEKEKLIPPAKILAVTAKALTGDREQCLAAGMNDYVSKPFNLDELRLKMAELLKT